MDEADTCCVSRSGANTAAPNSVMDRLVYCSGQVETNHCRDVPGRIGDWPCTGQGLFTRIAMPESGPIARPYGQGKTQR